MCLLIRPGTIVTLTALLAFTWPLVDSAPLLLFEDTRFRGIRSEFKIEGAESCVNIRGKLNDMFSSANLETGECFLICEHDFCRGRCIEVRESITDLQALGLNDAASSIKRCPSSTTTTASPSTTTVSSSTTTRTTTSTSSTTPTTIRSRTSPSRISGDPVVTTESTHDSSSSTS